MTNQQVAAAHRGYATAWQLIAHLVKVPDSPVDQACGALTHFCKQYQVYLTDYVRQASLSGHDATTTTKSYRNTLVIKCFAFAKLKSGLLTTTNKEEDLLWSVLYYCLRCGDAVAAEEVAQEVTSPTLAPVQRIIATMAHNQRESLWEAGPPRLALEDQRAVEDLLERAKHQEVGRNFHQIGVLTLLSGAGQPVTSETVEGFKTIEDFLTGSLWIALIRRNPVDELIRLGKNVLESGPAYFEDAGSGGWSFALPLFATQQYQKALSYLADVGGPMGLMQAVHLGLVLSGAGISLRDLGMTDPISDGVYASLLVAYAMYLLAEPEAGSLASLNYLVYIPNRTRARKEVAKLIAHTGEFAKLAGNPGAEGMRQQGAVDEYFSQMEVSSILSEAAELLLRERGDRQKTANAIMCFMLAERYGDVLAVLNELLSPPQKPDEDRAFWLTQVQKFHTHYLAKRTHVLEVLERENKMALIRTSRILVDLNAFERLRSERKSNEAWNIVEGLNLLPLKNSDLTSMESGYRVLDPLVKQAFPWLIVGATDILFNEYNRLKVDLPGSSGVVRERLNELSEKARLLSTFAASVGMASDQIAVLSRQASLMI
jgi:nuclear pore complex protein Nup93